MEEKSKKQDRRGAKDTKKDGKKDSRQSNDRSEERRKEDHKVLCLSLLQDRQDSDAIKTC